MLFKLLNMAQLVFYPFLILQKFGFSCIVQVDGFAQNHRHRG